jgi:hypothetical protein
VVGVRFRHGWMIACILTQVIGSLWSFPLLMFR